MDSVLDVLLERMEIIRADEVLLQNATYLALQEEIDAAQERVSFSPELDALLDAYSSAYAHQSKLMYRQGMLDYIELLKELKAL